MTSISAYLDRFEEEYAVLYLGEEMAKVDFPRHYLPNNLQEGDYLVINIARDTGTTEQAEREARKLLGLGDSTSK